MTNHSPGGILGSDVRPRTRYQRRDSRTYRVDIRHSYPEATQYGRSRRRGTSRTGLLLFFRKCRRGGAHEGKIYGFPLGGKCFINRDCKVAPIRKYLAEIAGGPMRAKTNIVQYIGIAADEPRRLTRLTENKISLLAKYGYTEQMAKQLCAAHGLLSPIYTTGTRGGCWFCPNCKIQHFVNLRRNHPELWAELVELSHTPNLCSYGFKYGLTVQEVEKRMDAHEQQLTLF